jgi:hypothetical protein
LTGPHHPSFFFSRSSTLHPTTTAKTDQEKNNRPLFIDTPHTLTHTHSHSLTPQPQHHTNQPTGDRTGRFSGVADCFIKTAREEGLGAFYKGFIPNFARLGSWNVVMFLTLEQVKKLFQPAPAVAA